jgi:hypothetical protein
MSTGTIIFLALFIVVLGVFAYLSTKEGFVRALNSLLRILIPMLLTGVIVLIARFILAKVDAKSVEMIKFIVAAIGMVIFYLVLMNVFKNPEKKKLNVFNIFFGFLVGIVEGWLVCGIVVLYLDYINLFNIRKVLESTPLFQAIVLPVKWLLFFDFIRIR